MQSLIIVDGYNIINAWDDLKKIQQKSLEDAREALIAYLAGYSAVSNIPVTVVFDGADIGINTNDTVNSVNIIFSSNGKTADTVIEALVYKKVKKGINVTVVSSDKDQQFMVLGAGASRVSAREFEQDVKGRKKEFQKDLKFRQAKNQTAFNTLEDRLDKDIVKKLKKI